MTEHRDDPMFECYSYDSSKEMGKIMKCSDEELVYEFYGKDPGCTRLEIKVDYKTGVC